MPVPYIDIHTHLYKENDSSQFSLPNVIIGKEVLTAQPCSAGIHPHYITENTAKQLDDLTALATASQVMAIGECGLDKLCSTHWAVQTDLFRKHIVLANKIDKPIIIHCVRAYQECLNILKEEKVRVPVIFHGFNKNIQLAWQILNQGYFISLDPMIIHGKKDILIERLPLDKIFLETDGKPIKITAIYTYFCEVRKISMKELKEQIDSNFKTIFNRFIRK